ncbi:TetR/AcrR family transcriptional regulator [Microbacterium cremeum]|uniref:TetR/AcrR family transcriptional regulator n=1 Tax=Microbacterium cremeum TaxID=2782169 RepID=UPI0018885C80|nr:TetR/AcrR family transcriptional regulator [Microbacterium cremeum]
MSRTSAQNEALRAATREAVEGAAIRVFARHGFAAANMRQIAAEAGLSIGSIYRHYPSKEQLFEQLLQQATTGLVAASDRLSGVEAPLDLAREFTATFLSDLAGDHGAAEFYLVINQGFLTDTPQGTTQRLASTQAALWRSFSALVRRGQNLGEFAAGDPDRITAYYFAMLSGIATMRSVMNNELGESGVELVLRLLTKGRAT